MAFADWICKVRRGVTLVEIVIATTIIVALAALAIPLYVNFQSESLLDTTSQDIVQTIREAQTRAMAGDGDRPWGVNFAVVGDDAQYTLFRGVDYANRDPAYDRSAVLAGSLTFGALDFSNGSTTVVFQKVRGMTDNFGSLTLTSTNGETATITVNAAGAVDVR